ncbi:MAG: peptide-binding protein [Nitrospinota bacterium]|nr:peptide-binding protein [Nitrospinota bacterium]
MGRYKTPALVLLLSASLAAGGCEKKKESGPGPQTAAQAAAYAKRDYAPDDFGDVFMEGSIGDASNLLPYLAKDSSSSEITNKLFSSLMTTDKDQNLIPDLARSWEISEDQRTITFHLRDDVKWHDGKPWTSADLKYQYEMMIHPDVQSAYKDTFFQMEGVQTPDAHTFIVTFKEPFAPGLTELSGMGGLPTHLLKDTKPADLIKSPLARNPVGNGPWKFVSWDTQQSIILEANVGHYNQPRIHRYVMRIIPDLAVQFLELKAKKIDNMGLKPLQYLKQTDTSFFKDNFEKYKYLGQGYTYMGYNLKRPLFQDKRVRQALTYAINKQEIVDAALLGLGVPATGPIKYGTWAYKDDVKRYPYNPAMAKQLMDEAGWKDTNGDGVLDKDGKPFEFEIITNQGNDVRKNSAQVIQQNLKRIGVTAKLRVIEWSAFINNFINKRDFDAVILGWGLGLDPDPYPIWHSSKTGEHEFNFVSFTSAEVDELLEKGRRTFDLEKRKEYYWRFQDILAEEQPYTFLYVPEALPIVSKRIRDIVPGAAGIGYNFEQWWVPKQEHLRNHQAVITE